MVFGDLKHGQKFVFQPKGLLCIKFNPFYKSNRLLCNYGYFNSDGENTWFYLSYWTDRNREVFLENER